MSDTNKLLRAFIEASGYEIEEVKTTSKIMVADGWNSEINISDSAIDVFLFIWIT